MTTALATSPVFTALDTTDVDHACALAVAVKPYVRGVKLGLEFFLAHGKEGYLRVAECGVPIFLDLKLHDIPNTVAGGIRAVADLKPAYLTLHTQGGWEMMRRAADTVSEYSPATRLLGVTVLTSLDTNDLAKIGVKANSVDQVTRLATLAELAGLNGVVCSPHEAAKVRAETQPSFELMVPGIRPSSSATGDQKRVMTPRAAIKAGATHLVIGRPITGAQDPAKAARLIAEDLSDL